MPPWPIRRGSHTGAEVATDPTHIVSPGVQRPSLHGHRFDDDDDSSASDSGLHPPRSGKGMERSGHARSMSTPFPSFFSAGKMTRSGSSGKRVPPNSDSNSSNDGLFDTRGHRVPNKGSHQRGGHNRHPGRDFTAGNCMTCGSHMRWPRELWTFRCTICLTINDLAPRPTGDTEDGPTGRLRGTVPHVGSAGDHLRPDSVKLITSSHTRWLIRESLLSFLKVSLGCEESRAASIPQLVLNHETATGFVTGERMGTSVVPEPNKQAPHAPQATKSTGPQVEQMPTPPRLRFPRGNIHSRSHSSSYTERPVLYSARNSDEQSSRPLLDTAEERSRPLFQPLEDYIMSSFSSFECVNSSFSTMRDHARIKSESVSDRRHVVHRRRDSAPAPTEPILSELDPKLLMVGDIAENGTWWAGSQNDSLSPRGAGQRQGDTKSHVSHRSPRIDWDNLRAWYDMVIRPGQGWRQLCDEIINEYSLVALSAEKLDSFEAQILAGQARVQKVLLRATESLLRRPGRPITDPGSLRFLLIVLHNPLLRPDNQTSGDSLQSDVPGRVQNGYHKASLPELHAVAGPHSEITKRVLGLISQSSLICHDHLVSWFARLPRNHFKQIKDIVSAFLTYRLMRQNNTQPEIKIDLTHGLVPDLSAGRFVSVLHAALEGGQPNEHEKANDKKTLVYSDDWQVRAASRVMALIFAANNLPTSLGREAAHGSPLTSDGYGYSAQHGKIRARGQVIPTSDFYNPLVDLADPIVDFEAWEAKRGAFTFCQYPFLLSISSKTEVLEHEARRQMKSKARDAFFDSILTRKNVNQHWVLDVRRDCLVEDSLKRVSEIIGSGSEDIKKSLRISFSGEEGIDHGGLRKEWFLLLVREVFNPDNGMFIYEEDSNYCYFNPHCFETSDQFFLVGVVMGLAIYNSTILDIPLPPFTFRKLLATGPSPPVGSAAHPKPILSYGIDDLAEIRPQLASGLRQLLEYDGNVEETFSLDFMINTNKYGTSVQVPLLPEGAGRAVTNENRRKYVDLYVRYLLDASVNRQFEPFKRGFYTVCGGSALTLFRPEEIELLVRGSDEVLDIAALRGVAVYDNWGTDSPDDGSEPAVQWFWEAFARASSADQRKLLLFITGSDRIPAAGASSLHIKISCLGDDSERFPIARTCFNMLVLWRYSSREKLERKLWMAAHESEGFGLK